MKRLFTDNLCTVFVGTNADRICIDFDFRSASIWAHDDSPVTVSIGTKSALSVTPAVGKCERLMVEGDQFIDTQVSLETAEQLHATLGKALRAARKERAEMQAEQDRIARLAREASVKFSIDSNGHWTQEG